jgi:hypothetical protein
MNAEKKSITMMGIRGVDFTLGSSEEAQEAE